MSLSRTLYLMSRAAGDGRAVRRGRYGRRVAKRYYHRGVIRALRRLGAW